MKTKFIIALFAAFILGAVIVLTGVIVSKPSTYIQAQYNYPENPEPVRAHINKGGKGR